MFIIYEGIKLFLVHGLDFVSEVLFEEVQLEQVPGRPVSGTQPAGVRTLVLVLLMLGNIQIVALLVPGQPLQLLKDMQALETLKLVIRNLKALGSAPMIPKLRDFICYLPRLKALGI
jgi:hypothetical protein